MRDRRESDENIVHVNARRRQQCRVTTIVSRGPYYLCKERMTRSRVSDLLSNCAFLPGLKFYQRLCVGRMSLGELIL
jgi:hypothetical protein